MIKYVLYTFLLLTLLSCVSQDKYDTVNAEKATLQQQKDALQHELQEIKFGAPNLLADGKRFFGAKDYDKAKEKLDTLMQMHPDRPESAEARLIMNVIEEENSWNTALNSSSTYNTQSYITNYPNGKYSSVAQKRFKDLKIAEEKSAYDNAVSQKSSAVWKSFISDYPDRSDIAEIKKRIITCEIDEIMGNKETGKLPSSNLTGDGGYSSSSSVSITNDTQCELTVRYSGADVKMIEIPIGDTRLVYLSSGSYRIAASACGSNYAGIEDLQGSYSSRYYIITTRY